jgi:hypothetical protein
MGLLPDREKIRNHPPLGARAETKQDVSNPLYVPCSSLGTADNRGRLLLSRNPISEGGSPQNSLLLWSSKVALISGFQRFHNLTKSDKYLPLGRCWGGIRIRHEIGEENQLGSRRVARNAFPRFPHFWGGEFGLQRGPAFSPYSIIM